MRANQLNLRFDEPEDLRRVWAGMSDAERASIARLYARVLVKAAKVDLTDPPSGKGQDREP